MTEHEVARGAGSSLNWVTRCPLHPSDAWSCVEGQAGATSQNLCAGPLSVAHFSQNTRHVLADLAECIVPGEQAEAVELGYQRATWQREGGCAAELLDRRH